jgi:exodeoxyribonuclease VII large subunit
MEVQAISVSELNKYVKGKIDNDAFLNAVYVKGEISNFKHHYTGHMYFTLKDESSLIKCIMFKGNNASLKFTPKDGTKVIIFGEVKVFERDGAYQIYAKTMEEDGVGVLYKKYQELKIMLEKKGYFDKNKKKKIPFMPKTIGVLTSQTGSVVRDIINVSTRRNPNVNLRILPVPVQGQGAGEKIAYAIKYMNENKLADVLILARGGGSLEDLWPFNEEVVADAIYNSELPIISAVGHETDFSISDFVADLRAPTPSAAAEVAVADIAELKMRLLTYQNRFKTSLKKKIEFMEMRYKKCMASRVFKEPLQKINEKYILIDIKVKAIENATKRILEKSKKKFGEVVSKLDALSPLKTLTRGYCLAETNGNIVRSVNAIQTGDKVSLCFVDGKKNAIVE